MDKIKQKANSNRETLSAVLQPESLNAENRTVDVIWFTGIDVTRMNWATGEPYILRFDPKGVDLSILNSGAPVLDDHDTYSGSAGQKGVVEKAWQENTDYKATLRFSKRPEVDGLWQDIQDKIVQKFSMGTEVLEKKDVTPAGTTQRVVLATKWRPYEISIAPLAADMNTTTLANEPVVEPIVEAETLIVEAILLNKNDEDTGALPQTELKSMIEQKTDVVEAPKAENVNLEAARTAGRADATEILSRCNAAKLSVEFASKLIADGKSVEDASKAIFAELAKQDAKVETRSQVVVTRDETETRRTSLENAMLHRYNPTAYKLAEGREFVGMNLVELAKEVLSWTGVSVRGKSRMEVAQLAFEGTSDFPAILANVANKTLRAAYEAYPQTWRPLSKPNTAADFKSIMRTQLSEAPTMQKVGPSGEFKYVSLSDAKETYALATYGNIIPINRQAIINDNLGAFTRIPELHGRAAAQLESDVVWGLITANGNMGVDNTAIFHANHANLAGTSAVVSVASLGLGRAAMRKQKNIGGVEIINVMPRYLVVPAAIETVADQFLSATQIVFTKNTDVNPFQTNGNTPLAKICEPRLDAASTTAWYLAGDPGQVDMLEHSYLEGNQGVFIESRMGFEVDGMEVKARLDFGAAVLDWRGLYKNAGA